MENSEGKKRRITDIGWVGWTLMLTAALSVSAASYNYGISHETVQVLKEEVREHSKNCSEMHRTVQQLAIAVQVLDSRVNHLWEQHHGPDRKEAKK